MSEIQPVPRIIESNTANNDKRPNQQYQKKSDEKTINESILEKSKEPGKGEIVDIEV